MAVPGTMRSSTMSRGKWKAPMRIVARMTRFATLSNMSAKNAFRSPARKNGRREGMALTRRSSPGSPRSRACRPSPRGRRASPWESMALSASILLHEARIHGMVDDHAGPRRQRLRGRRDLHCSLRAALGGFDGREPKQGEAGTARAADLLVGAHGQHEGALGGARRGRRRARSSPSRSARARSPAGRRPPRER